MRLITIAVGILLAIFIASYHAQHKEAQAKDIQKAGTYTPSDPIPIHTHSASTEQKESRYQKTKGYLKRAFGPEFLASWVLVFAAGFGLYATFRTLGILQEQADAGKKSADAALLNAQAVLEAERPWIVISVERNQAAPPGYYDFVVTNKGRTPAIMLAGDFAHTFKQSANNLPVPPIYDSPFIAPNESLIVQGGNFKIQRTLGQNNLGTIHPETLIASHAKANPGIAVYDTLFFYGRIVYNDVFGRKDADTIPHETRWCFAFFKDGHRFVRTGPDGTDAYNQYT